MCRIPSPRCDWSLLQRCLPDLSGARAAAGKPSKFVEGSRTPSRKRGPRRTVHASFPRTRLEHSIKRRTDAGLAVLRKPFANVTLLIHLIAETRALNRGLPVSLKLPRVESQMRACDNCTTRKSASFQIRAKLEPLCNPLQAALRFFRVLIPTCPTASLASRLP